MLTPGVIRRRVVLSGLAAIITAPASRLALAQRSAPRPGVDYQLIPPQPVATGERTEVVEFFWYGCPHCHNLQPPLEAWLKRKPADVELRRIPAIFRESWVPHARLYYTLDALGEVQRLHQAVYRSIHGERESLMNPGATVEWAARHGIEQSRWSATYNSPEVERRVEESRSHTRAYSIAGTPSLVVDGRYLTSSGMAESMVEVIAILDGLIVIARERRAGTSK